MPQQDAGSGTTLQELVRGLPDNMTVGEAIIAASKKDPHIWTMRHRRLRGHPLFYDISKEVRQYELEAAPAHVLLRHRPFLIQPLRDLHPHKAYKKGRQVGVSELSITEVFYFLDANPGTKVIYCVPDDAEILTRKGWKHYHEVVPGQDETLGLDVETHRSKWTPIEAVVIFDYDGVLPAVGPFHCTSDHRWPVATRNQRQGRYDARVKRTTELCQRDRLIRMADMYEQVDSVLSPRLAAILGWVATDGHQRVDGRMEVYQSSKKYLEDIEQLLGTERRPASALSEAPTLRVGSRGGRVVGETSTGHAIYGDLYRVAVKPDDVAALRAVGYRGKWDLPWVAARLSPEAAQAMWEAMMLADGCLSGPESRSLFFAKLDPPVRDAFQILCALTGRAANLGKRGAYVIQPGTKHARIKPCAYDEAPREYRGIVWCPRTTTGTWYMRYRGRVVFTGNTFPRDTQLKDFSVTRIGEALEETKAMRKLMGVPNQVYTKRIGDSYMILRSAWESNLGEGVDADMVVLDEKDRMKEGVDIAFRESLQSSKFGLLREVSTPTLPGRGVDEPYQKSCQYEWFVKCTKCGTKQAVRYPDNVVQMKHVPLGTIQLEEGTYEYRCHREKCRGLLDRVEGEWVARCPSKTHIAGYHMPQTIAPWQDATKLMQKKIDYKYLQLWQNYCLAECSLGEKILMTDAQFDSCIAGHMWYTCRSYEWSRIVAGVDWGQFNWCLVWGVNAYNNLPYLIGFHVVEDSDADPLGSAREMAHYLENFDPDCIVADAGYGKDRNSHLLRVFGEGKFFACLSGDTKVATLDARGWKRIRDVRVGDWTYAWDGRQLVPTPVIAVHDNGRRECVRVVCKDGNGREKTIVCTPDHVFPLRFGGEKQAGELRPGDRLVPFKRYEVMGGKYRLVNPTNESRRLAYEHRVVCAGVQRVHHIDGDGLNNRPDNLVGMTQGQHRKAHPLRMRDYPAFMEQLRERNARDDRAYLRTSEVNAKRVATRRKRGWYKAERRPNNHEVVRVEPVGVRSVWDITVAHDAHNFALYDSVFVHNCYYNPSDKHSRTFKPQWVPNSGRVLADRTIALKDICRILRDQGVGLPHYDDKVALLKQHVKNLAPIQVEEDGDVYEVIDKTGPDHLAHCMAYCNMAFDYVTEGWRNFKVIE